MINSLNYGYQLTIIPSCFTWKIIIDLRVAIVNLLLTGRKHFFRETEKKTNQFYLGKKPIVMHPQNHNPKSIIITQIC